jgi:putative nucleotidyltransferase with HDIG domain
VLAALDDAEAAYLHFRAREEREAAALADAEAQKRRLATDLEAERKKAAREVDRAGQLAQELETERKRGDRQRERAEQMAELMKEIHRSLFSGNIYEMILRACLTLSGGTRGLYITVRAKDNLRIRAAIDIDGYPQAPASAFIRAICERVLKTDDTLVCNTPSDQPDLPTPERPGEQFRNFLAAPVVLLKDLDGILLVADKVAGAFDEEDVETLLSVGDQAAVAAENAQLRRTLESAYVQTIGVLADAVEAKDPYTYGHCEAVSRFARLIARHLGLSAYEVSVASYAGLLHDVGKIGVSDGVLNKPGALLPEERELMRAHSRIGHDLIHKVPELTEVADAVLHHHEWYDGSGYPDGLAGEAIARVARIVSVADCYSAMITRRSYKDSYTEEHARSELVRCAGSQFDPKMVEAFLAVLDGPELRGTGQDDDLAWGTLPGFVQDASTVPAAAEYA